MCEKADSNRVNAEYETALNILNGYQKNKMQEQTERMTARERTKKWLSILGCDISELKVIHIAGSKGKGTTSYYCSHLLTAHQSTLMRHRKVGCYTSPHQVDVRERIQFNERKIPKELFSRYVRKLHQHMELLRRQPVALPPTPGYPGFLALLAIYIFVSEKVDIAVIETGIGGENDSTNIFPRPVATGVTSIGLDHVPLLGTTVEEIAWHKAGIFKSGSPAFALDQDEAVLEVFRMRARDAGAAGDLQVVTDRLVDQYGISIYPDMLYQRKNASLALALVESYLKNEYPDDPLTTTVAQTLRDVVLPGRCQVIEDGDNTWFISIAHSELSLRETTEWFKGLMQQADTSAPKVLIFNTGFSKSATRAPEDLLKSITKVLCTQPSLLIQGAIFCTSQSDENGKEKSDQVDLRINRSNFESLDLQKNNARIWRALHDSGRAFVATTAREAIELTRQRYPGSKTLITGCTFLASSALYLLMPASGNHNTGRRSGEESIET